MEPVTLRAEHNYYASVDDRPIAAAPGAPDLRHAGPSAGQLPPQFRPSDPARRVHGGRWLVDERGTWIADYRAAFVETELWGAMDLLIKLDHQMCVKFSQEHRTWFATGRDEYPQRSVREFVPSQGTPGMENPQHGDYFAGTVLSRDSEAGKWVQQDVELARREVIHYMQQPALPHTHPATGAETLETDLTGLRGEQASCQRLVLRGLKTLARNYWLEALHRFASAEFQVYKTPRYRENLKFKMRRVMRKLCQRLELLSMLMPHFGPDETPPPQREGLDGAHERVEVVAFVDKHLHNDLKLRAAVTRAFNERAAETAARSRNARPNTSYLLHKLQAATKSQKPRP